MRVQPSVYSSLVWAMFLNPPHNPSGKRNGFKSSSPLIFLILLSIWLFHPTKSLKTKVNPNLSIPSLPSPTLFPPKFDGIEHSPSRLSPPFEDIRSFTKWDDALDPTSPLHDPIHTPGDLSDETYSSFLPPPPPSPISNEQIPPSISKAINFNPTITPSMDHGNNLTVEQKWVLASGIINKIVDGSIKGILPFLLHSFTATNISSSCSTSLFQILLGLKSNQGWAFSFLDASGKIPSGLLTGTLSDLGDYDQCLDIKAKEWNGHMNTNHGPDLTSSPFGGQYCLINIRPALPFPNSSFTLEDEIVNLRNTSLQGTMYEDVARIAQGFYSLPIQVGVCAPSLCSGHEVESILRKVFIPLFFTTQLRGSCDKLPQDSAIRHLDAFQLTSLAILLVFIVATVAGSVLDISFDLGHSPENPPNVPSSVPTGTTSHPLSPPISSSTSSSVTAGDSHHKSNFLFHLFISSFSVRQNTRKLFSLSTSSEFTSTRLQFVHGTRVLTMLWIIVCHTYTFGTQFLTAIGSVRIEHQIRPMGREYVMQFILNGWFSVETFFFLSGVILVYIAYPAMVQTKGKLDFIQYVALRWIRFIPGLCGLMILNFLWPLVGSGPVFKEESARLVSPCYSGWWKNLLFISNWAESHDEICMKHTWYLSADFQLHVLAFASLKLLYWNRMRGITFNLLMIALGVIIPAIVVLVYNLPPTMLVNTPFIEKFDGYFSYFYFPTFNHFSPYFMGILVGYVLTTQEQLSVSKMTKNGLWIGLPLLAISTVLSTVAWNRYNLAEYPALSAFYAGSNRFFWATAMAWIALSCGFNQGGLAQQILSAKFWLPFSRLSYQIYLVHFIVVYYHYLTQRSPVQFTHYDRLFMSCGIVVFSLVLAFVTYILFEAPIGHLVKKLIIEKMVGKKEIDKEENNIHKLSLVKVMTIPSINNVS